MTYYQHPTTGDVLNLTMPIEGWAQLTIAKGKAAQREQAKTELRRILKPGDTVHTILRHVSRSGMMRHISVLHGMQDVTHLVALALDDKRADNGGIKCTGCGMDMGFHLVYNLGATLWPNGTPTPHGRRNGEPDSSGGYALKHQWL